MKLDKGTESDSFSVESYFPKSPTRTVCITTNGCSENRIDCAKMEKFFTMNGWSVTSDVREADIVLFNACGVTTIREDASLEVLKHINEQKKPSAEVIVWGCFPKINIDRLGKAHQGVIFASDEEDRLEEIFESDIKSQGVTANFLVPTFKRPHSKHTALRRLVRIINVRSFVQGRLDRYLWEQARDLVSFVDPDSFFIKACTGCLDACTYCGVRLSRGRLKSKPVSMVTQEFKNGLDSGFKKFTLVGTDLGAYGRDQGNSLTDLLKALFSEEDDCSLRLPNINPRWLLEIMPELLQLIEEHKIEVIGSGVQSGSNRILRLMNRRYRIEDYKEAMIKLKSAYPQLQLRTNIIVGFPSEREEDFQETVRLLEEVHFTYADIHKYAPRPRTRAAIMPDQIPSEVIEDRYSRLRRVFLMRLRENVTKGGHGYERRVF